MEDTSLMWTQSGQTYGMILCVSQETAKMQFVIKNNKTYYILCIEIVCSFDIHLENWEFIIPRPPVLFDCNVILKPCGEIKR